MLNEEDSKIVNLGDRWRFWKGIIPATIQYRKDILKEMKNEPND